MIFCRGCGKEIHESAISCPQCGAQQVIQKQALPTNSGDSNIFISYINAWKTAFVFKGRVRRKSYWYFALTNVIVIFVLALIDQALRGNEVLVNVYNVAAFVPGISMGIKRMHDVGKSGWWVIVPFVNLYFAIKDSEYGMNEYGLSPKYAMA